MSFEISFDLPPDWQLKTVQELVNEKILEKPLDGNHGGIHPKASDYVEKGIPFIMASDLEAGLVNFSSCKYISLQQAGKLRKGFAQEGDVLLSHKATIGRTAIVQPNDSEFIVLTPQVTYYRVKDENKLNNIYLKSFFDSYFFQTILNQWAGSGSTRAYLGITEQLKLPVIVPPIDSQIEIASFANNLNSKIHLNNKINQTLESIAQAIFKSWFIDFDPVRAKIAAKQEEKDPELAAMCSISGKCEAEIEQMAEDDFAELQATAALFPDEFVDSELGEIPKGWEISKISKIGKVITGKTPSSKIENSFAEKGTFFITPTDIDTEVFVTNTNRYLSEHGEIAIKNSKIDEGSLCITCIGSQMGKVVITPKSAFTNQQINSILLFNSTLRNYIFLNLRQRRDEIFLIGSGGSTMPIINKSTFESLNLILPDLALIRKFDNFISPFFNNILSNSVENIELKNIRDALLPELLAGKINVFMLKDM